MLYGEFTFYAGHSLNVCFFRLLRANDWLIIISVIISFTMATYLLLQAYRGMRTEQVK